MKKNQDILSIFQEGVFEELSMNGKDLNFKIECKYLADQIKPNYSCFYGVFKSVSDIYFVPWDDHLMEVRSIEEIKKLSPDILSVESEDDYIKIYSNCRTKYSGGNFFICAESVKIFDEDFQELLFEDILGLADKYWYSHNKAEG